MPYRIWHLETDYALEYLCIRLQAPALAVFALQILVGVGDVRDLALLAVVVDALALAGLHGHDAEEHRFGQAAGVLEWAGGFLLALDGVDPVHPVFRLRVRAVVVLLDAEVGLRNFRRHIHQRSRVELRTRAV